MATAHDSLARSEELVRSRAQTQAEWVDQHGQRMDQLAGLWRTEMAALREEENQRGHRLAERENLALQERTVLLEKLGALLQAVNQSSGEQRVAIEALVTSASSVLDAHAGKAADIATHVTASAVELSSLGEAFSHGVQLFQATNDRLMETLQRIETSLNRSTARSDEQLAYYVAQAREVIDLSIASQQGLVDNLRQLQGKPDRPGPWCTRMMELDDSDDAAQQVAPVWAVFGDLMSGLLGAFVLILVGVLVVPDGPGGEPERRGREAPDRGAAPHGAGKGLGHSPGHRAGSR